MFILTLIGLAVVLWFISKMFNKVGNALDKIGDALAEWSTYSGRTPGGYGGSEKARAKIREKINALHGEGTDQEYQERIRKEIDDLTKE